MKDKVSLEEFTMHINKMSNTIKSMPYCPKLKADVKVLKKSVKRYIKRTVERKNREMYKDRISALRSALKECKNKK